MWLRDKFIIPQKLDEYKRKSPIKSDFLSFLYYFEVSNLGYIIKSKIILGKIVAKIKENPGNGDFPSLTLQLMQKHA